MLPTLRDPGVDREASAGLTVQGGAAIPSGWHAHSENLKSSWKASSRVPLAVTEEHTVSRQVCSAPGFLVPFSPKSQSQTFQTRSSYCCFLAERKNKAPEGKLIWPRLIHRALPPPSVLFAELFSLCSHCMRYSQRGNLTSAQTPHTGPRSTFPGTAFRGNMEKDTPWRPEIGFPVSKRH